MYCVDCLSHVAAAGAVLSEVDLRAGDRVGEASGDDEGLQQHDSAAAAAAARDTDDDDDDVERGRRRGEAGIGMCRWSVLQVGDQVMEYSSRTGKRKCISGGGQRWRRDNIDVN